MILTSSPAGTRTLAAADIEALALGAWILGTGGGGDPYQKLLNLRLLYRAGKRVALLDPMYLSDTDPVAVVSGMGSPLVGQERLADPNFSVKPLRMMEEYCGLRFKAVMSIEIGGGNGLQPLMVAALTGLPVVDADAMGRAFPEAQMTSFAAGGLSMVPLALADIRDNETMITRAASPKWVERVARKVCTEYGSSAATCKPPRTGVEVKRHAILYSVSKATRIGQAVFNARARHEDPIAAVLQETGGKCLFRGKVVDVERHSTEGFLRGRARLAGSSMDHGADQSSDCTLHFQNEFSLCELDGEVCAMTPDLICVLDSVTGDGIGTDTLRFGQRVTVLALPAPEVFTTPQGLALVGPRAFGFDCDYRPAFT